MKEELVSVKAKLDSLLTRLELFEERSALKSGQKAGAENAVRNLRVAQAQWVAEATRERIQSGADLVSVFTKINDLRT